MLSIYSRHYPPCPSDDINYKRCRCPKWINGVLGSDGPFIRRSAKTRSWEKAEDFKPKLEEELQVHPWLFIWLRRGSLRGVTLVTHLSEEGRVANAPTTLSRASC